MNWKFWQKGENGTSGGGLPKPKDLPEAVGRHLVVDLNLDPDLVWSLKAVLRPREEGRDMADIRVFNPGKADAAGVTVRNYTTLDGHPELVLYEGWFNKKTHQIKITSKAIEKAA
jgi:hypothetical protein